MPLPITALYAGVLALIILALGVNVTMYRIKLRVSLGDGGNPVMLRMMRLHANAIEYIPLALLLMAFYEFNGGWRPALHVIGIALIVGRLIQVSAMWGTDMPGTGRVVGQGLTWTSIGVLALLNLWKSVM